MALGRIRKSSRLRIRLPGRTVRTRLTITYGSVLLLGGAVLITITALLWSSTTSRSSISIPNWLPGRILSIRSGKTPGNTVLRQAKVGPPFVVVHNRKYPLPRGLPKAGGTRDVGRVLQRLQYVATSQHRSDLTHLLIYSGIALAIMGLIGVLISWITAGRALQPLRQMNSVAKEISASNLHERLDLEGPRDELRQLGETFDELLERLERSFQSQRQFVANASHELRTPLATMRASVDVALAKPEAVPADFERLAGRLRFELDHIDELLEGFLTLARAQQGPATGDVTVSLSQLARQSLDRRTGRIAELGLELHLAPARGVDDEVTGNRVLLTRMVENLIDNAVQYNETAGFISVSTEAEPGKVRLRVENGGPAMDPDSLAELVEPFRRLGPDRTGSNGGLGLGLSIVSAIAEAHGGHLQLRPRSGGGVSAVVELRAAPASLSLEEP